MTRHFINPFEEMKNLYNEAEDAHRKDDDLLETIYKHETTSSVVKRMIERRWAENGGRYIDGVYHTFKDAVVDVEVN